MQDLLHLLAPPTSLSVPNLHPLFVHLPVALLTTAVLVDVAILFVRPAWLDRAATLLYVLGTAGAGAAWLTGDLAEEGFEGLGGAAQATLAEHQDLATLTLIAFCLITAFRLMVTWLARNDRRIQLGFFRLLALPLALVGVLLLANTADHGGSLVFEHGVGVEQVHPPHAE